MKEKKEAAAKTCSEDDEIQQNVAKLKMKIEDAKLQVDYDLHDDYRLACFITGAENDLDKAYHMFKTSLKWREEVGADNIFQTAPQTNKNFDLLMGYWPGVYHGVDRDGCPVYYERLGGVDVRGLLNTVPIEDMMNVHVYQQEQSRAIKAQTSKEKGTSMYAGIFVQDLAGLGMSHMYSPGFDLFQKIVAFDQANYPDSLKAYYLINAPAILPMIYNMIKPLLDANTRTKVKILGSDYHKSLLEAIDLDNLPTEYGGQCKCTGHCIPKGGKFIDTKPDGTTYNPVNVTVGRKDKHKAQFHVTKGSLIRWMYTTKASDLKFNIYLADQKAEKKYLKHSVSQNGHERNGHLCAKKAGTYTLQWDNSHSLFSSKQLTFQVFIEPPQAAEEVTSTDDRPLDF